MRIFKILLFVFITASLAACSSTAEKLRNKSDRYQLSSTIGKPYAAIAASKSLKEAELFATRETYGRLIDQVTLPSGDTVYKHAGLREAGESSFDFSGLIGTSKTKLEYAIYYFRVGPDGMIRDYANGIVQGDRVNCIAFISGLITTCQNTDTLTADFTYIDTIVRTANGKPYSAWQ
ncbi:hypothetical protein [Rhizobium sp. L1K21]|uniref:hypothetical protein n=1 Tax=Rhizobium sp. L1K21 TaxID=2954933 RepID=UPI002093ACCD|nr:hypothetical protein [Rhizobium sp. L1K21]MCO6187348.1 hypothetical protein [Rhizobium sp. L1K21]